MHKRYLLLFALASAGFAQQASPLQLTLKDAVTLALKQNPQVILANLGVDRSEQERLSARGALLPQIGGGVSETQHRVNLQAALGWSFPGMPQHVGPFEVFQFGAQMQAPVFDLTLWRRYRASQLGVEASRATELSAREDSVLLVVSQYLGSQRAAANVRTVQSQVELAQALYDLAADLQKNGVGTGIDTLRANVQLQNQKQLLIQARTGLDTALFALARLLNIDPRQPIQLADQVSFSDTQPVPVDQALDRAYAGRAELKQLGYQMQQSELALKAAGESRYPKLTASGNWLEQGLTPNSVIPVYNYQLSLDFPLFTGGRIQAARADADLAIRQLRQREQDLRNRVAQEVKTAVAQLDAARSEVDVANLGVDLARQEVDQARDRFQAGVANNIEVISAQDSLARAANNQIGALYRYNQARADLAHAEGQMEAVYGR
jgi:outer membrane protein